MGSTGNCCSSLLRECKSCAKGRGLRSPEWPMTALPRAATAGRIASPRSHVKGSVTEIERAMTSLKLNGAVLNSHFQGRYLDEPAYEPILEALEALDAALYIHPTAPYLGPHYKARGFYGALGGFPHDVWLHTMGLIFSGAFDKYPKLRLVIGHLGECLPLRR
jgi:predicted TIM-barrel fold metal-dependent hydrolase